MEVLGIPVDMPIYEAQCGLYKSRSRVILPKWYRRVDGLLHKDVSLEA